MARLTQPTLLADEELVITEQVFHAPDEAARIDKEKLMKLEKKIPTKL